jgi:hypothetical protein
MTLLYTTFKIFAELLKTYIVIIIQIVFAPITLMFGALPGKNTFGKWIKSLAGNLLMWPVVLLAILVERMLTAPLTGLTNDELNSAYGGGFMPPFLLGQGQAKVIPVMLGVGILLVIPEIMKQAKKAMGVEDNFGNFISEAKNNLKNALTYEPAIALGGYGAIKGAAKGLISNAQTGRPFNLREAVPAVFSNVREETAVQLKRANNFSRNVQNVIEGKTFDPNNLERIMINTALENSQSENAKLKQQLKEKNSQNSAPPTSGV